MMARLTLMTCAAALLAGATALASFSAGQSEIADAAMRSDKAAVRTLLDRKIDVNATQTDGTTALHWAVYNGDLELVDLLIRAHAKPDAANREGVTPAQMASLYGSSAMLDRLLEAGADAKQRGPAGETLLMLAARNGNPDCIKVLVGAGADVNAKERLRGTTALMWAVEQRHPAAVKALLGAGADFSARSAGAGLPRNYMAQRVNVGNVQAASRRYAAAAAAGRTYEQQLIAEGNVGRSGTGAANIQAMAVQVIEQAKAKGTDVQTALASFAGLAASAGIDIRALGTAVQQLAGGQVAAAPPAPGRQGAGRNAGAQRAAAAPEDGDDGDAVIAGLVGTGGGGLTALVFAAREGDLESAKALLDKGADVNQVTEYGWTPLLTATNNRHYKLAEFLIERGADVNRANKGQWTPLYLGTDNRNIEGGDFPVSKPDVDHIEFIKFLLDHGADPNGRVKDNTLTRTVFTMQWFFESGATPFVRAAQSADIELLKLLLAHGADALLKTDFGDTALTAAAGIGWVEGVTYEHSVKNNVETIKLLLDLGLDPNAANQDGRTPLMGAALKGRSEVIQLLVDHGAKLDQRDKGSRDTDKTGSQLAGHTWQPLDYADGLVRTGVQSAVARPEAAAFIRKLMAERGMPVPPPNRVVDSICVVEICKERQPVQK